MMKEQRENFTKFEVARIIGARALQIAMDAPLLVKMSEEELKAIQYDSLRIADKELSAGALPISISRPMPQKRKDKLATIKEEKVSDAELAAREKEVEKEIVEDAEQLGLVEEEEEIEIEQNTNEEQ
ncbi:DNA-directed RNA polymerase subunit K [Candidatus Pacearchaeota archaeon]|nr:DNA-directed RNA polymerase subunit K [Candidatus Pacearchaeota archaeon]